MIPPSPDGPGSGLLEALRASLQGRYRVEGEVGRGGMATVFRARDLRHDRDVAVKVLDPEVTSDVGAARFDREIRTVAGLQHPGILPLYDSGEAAGHLFYVMPLVEGESLRERIDREGELSIPYAVRIARDLAQALAYAHGRGVVHRDVKPGNVLLFEGRPVLADFGIARVLERRGEERVTAAGQSVGTPAYMSPEQLQGEEVDGRTDVYALGCVLYEMLAGEPPFTGRTARTVMARQSLDPVPPVRTVRSTVPASLERAIHRALAKVPADRFSSAAEMAAALEEVGREDPVPSTFWEELRRRHVYRTAGVYGASAFVLVQVAELTFPTLGVEERFFHLLVLVALAGFPVAVALAWMYDLSRRGVRRATPFLEAVGAGSGTDARGTRAAWQPFAALVLVAAVAGAGAWAWWSLAEPGRGVGGVSGGSPPAEEASAREAAEGPATAVEAGGAPVAPEGMVTVPGGTYTVGTASGRPLDGPPHPVELAPFAIERTEVTRRAWHEFVEANGGPSPWGGGAPAEEWLPVTGVFQPEAEAYCGWRYPGGRLPTEEEWEAAARGEGGLYPWGEEWRPGAANVEGSGAGAPIMVGAMPPSPRGIHDQIGNVWEWTRSSLRAYPGGPEPPGEGRYFVIRGGAYNTDPEDAHASYRGYLPAATGNRSDFSATGLRCAVPLGDVAG